MIWRLKDNPPASTFKTTAVTQEEPLPTAIRRYRGRPKGTTGRKWGPRTQFTGHTTYLAKLQAQDKIKHIKRPFCFKVTTKVKYVSKTPTTKYTGPNLEKAEKFVPETQDNQIPHEATVDQIIVAAKKFAVQRRIGDIFSYENNSEDSDEQSQKNQPVDIEDTDFNKHRITRIPEINLLQKIGALQPAKPKINITGQETIRPAIGVHPEINIIQHKISNIPAEPLLIESIPIRQIQLPTDNQHNLPIFSSKSQDPTFMTNSHQQQRQFDEVETSKQNESKRLIPLLKSNTSLQKSEESKTHISKLKSNTIPNDSDQTNQVITQTKFNSDPEIPVESDQSRLQSNKLEILSSSMFKLNIINIDELIPTGFTDQQLVNPQIPSSSTANPSCLNNDQIFDPKLHFIIPKIPGMNLQNNYMLALAEQQKIIKSLRAYNRKLLKKPRPSWPKPNIVQPVISNSPPNIVQPINSSSSKKRTKSRNYDQLIKHFTTRKSLNLIDIFSESNQSVVKYDLKYDTNNPAEVNVSVLTPKFNIVSKMRENTKHHYKVLNAGPGRGWRRLRRKDKNESDDNDEDSNNLEKDDETIEEISNRTQNLSDNRMQDLLALTKTRITDVSTAPCDLNTKKTSKPDILSKKSITFEATNVIKETSRNINKKRKIVSNISEKNRKPRKTIASGVTVQTKKKARLFKVKITRRKIKAKKYNFKDKNHDEKSRQSNIEEKIKSSLNESSNINKEIESTFIQPIGELPNHNDLSDESDKITDHIIGGDLASFSKESENSTPEENKTVPTNTRPLIRFFYFVITSTESSNDSGRSNRKKEIPKKSSSTKKLSSVKKSPTTKKSPTSKELSTSTTSMSSKKLSNTKKSSNANKSPNAKYSRSPNKISYAKKIPKSCFKKSLSPEKFSNVSPSSSSNSLSSSSISPLSLKNIPISTSNFNKYPLKSKSSKTSPSPKKFVPKIIYEISRIDLNNFPSTILSSSETSLENIDMESKQYFYSSKKYPSLVKLLSKLIHKTRKVNFDNFPSPILSSSDTSLENLEIGSKKPVSNSKMSPCPKRSIPKPIECNIIEIHVYNYPIPTLYSWSDTSSENSNISLNKPASSQINETPRSSPISKKSPNSSSSSNTTSSTFPSYKTSLSSFQSSKTSLNSSQSSKKSSSSSRSFKKSGKQKKTLLKTIEHDISKIDICNYPIPTLSASQASPKNPDIKPKKSVFREVKTPERCEEKQEQLVAQVPDYEDNDRAEEIVIASDEMFQIIFRNYYCPTTLLSSLAPTPCSFECVEIISEQASNIEKSNGSINEVVHPEKTHDIMMEEINYSESVINEETLDLIPSHTEVPSHNLSELTDITEDELKYINDTLMTEMPNGHDTALDDLIYVMEEAHNTQPVAADFLTVCAEDTFIIQELGEAPVSHLVDTVDSEFTDLDDIPYEDLLIFPVKFDVSTMFSPELNILQLDEIVHGNVSSIF